MGGVYGTDQLEKIATDTAGLLNAAFKGGLVAVFDVLGELNDLRGVNFQLALSQVKELDPDERAKVETAFTSALSLPNAVVEEKIKQGVSLLEQGLDLAGKGVALFTEAVAFEKEVQTFVGA